MNERTLAHYDWQKTLSYDARITMVVTARGRGKTYGLRRQCVKDYLKDGDTFAEVCRYKSELPGLQREYFDKLQKNGEFPNHIFKCEAGEAFIAEKPADDAKPIWHTLGYFVALSEYQALKKRTFVGVRRILMDEAIIERLDRFHHYLTSEFSILQNVVDTLLREDATDPSAKAHRGRIYLLANACDLVNPYFAAFGIREAPAFGFQWFAGKNVLLHYEDPGTYTQAKEEGTLAGLLGSIAGDTATASRNEFTNANEDYVLEKPKSANFQFGVKYRQVSFGIWCDPGTGRWFVNRTIPNIQGRTVYALTAADNKADLLVARRAERPLQIVAEIYHQGGLYYDSPGTREEFAGILALFGVRLR